MGEKGVPMPTGTALGPELRDAIADLGTADLVVGIPSFKNAGTIAHVVEAARDGLRASFPRSRAVIVNSDGGSDDGTREVAARLDSEEVRVVSGRYDGLPGKGSALRAVFEAVVALDARAGAVVDSDLRSITPAWIERLLRPIVEDRADYVTPLYLRHKHDGTITNNVVYPVVRALYGQRVRQPIGGDFGFARSLAQRYLDRDVWESDVARFGIDVFMTTTALASGARLAQAALGAKVHDPKDPAQHLGPMFVQVVTSLSDRIREQRDAWAEVRGSRELPVEGEPFTDEPPALDVDASRLEAGYRAATQDDRARWRLHLCWPDQRPFEDRVGMAADPRAERLWARLVYDVIAAAVRVPDDAPGIVRSLLPLYLARVGMHVRAARQMTSGEAEALVERQAAAFESERRHLEEKLS